jgi:hypothetical protein
MKSARLIAGRGRPSSESIDAGFVQRECAASPAMSPGTSSVNRGSHSGAPTVPTDRELREERDE